MTTTADTRRAAREMNRPKAPAQREAIVDHIRSRGLDGATTDEIEMALGLPHQSASARVTELRDAGKIETLGEVRPTRTGARAIVYVVADSGHVAASPPAGPAREVDAHFRDDVDSGLIRYSHDEAPPW